jgi:mono/diheme cytochrome c family protein
MKKVSLIGLLIIGLIFQNCKNDKTQPAVLTEDDTETVIEQKDAIKVNEASEVAKEISSDSIEWIVPINYQKMKNPTYATKENVAIGKALYAKHCKSCHGKTGKGDGPKSDEFDSDIGDFSSKEFHEQSEGTIYYKSYVGQHDKPNYEKKIPAPEQMWYIVNYIKTLEK